MKPAQPELRDEMVDFFDHHRPASFVRLAVVLNVEPPGRNDDVVAEDPLKAGKLVSFPVVRIGRHGEPRGVVIPKQCDQLRIIGHTVQVGIEHLREDRDSLSNVWLRHAIVGGEKNPKRHGASAHAGRFECGALAGSEIEGNVAAVENRNRGWEGSCRGGRCSFRCMRRRLKIVIGTGDEPESNGENSEGRKSEDQAPPAEPIPLRGLEWGGIHQRWPGRRWGGDWCRHQTCSMRGVVAVAVAGKVSLARRFVSHELI